VLIPVAFVCPHCGQTIESAVDPSQGRQQSYVEDCQVCCRPLILRVQVEGGAASAWAEPEAG
jgi:hypothetical protein